MRFVRRRHLSEAAWAAFAIANILVIFKLGTWETVPFHFVWVSLSLLYGYWMWRTRTTAFVLAAVCIGTGLALNSTVSEHDGPGLDELTEVPLMAAMFLAMVWHAQRRQSALDEADRAAARERELVRDLSHQLRTPITAARGHAELLLASGLATEAREDVEVVLDELTRLSRISDRLLLMAVAEDPAFLRKTDVDVEELVVRTARRWGPAAERRWVIRAGAEGSISADADQLGFALDALIENAVKFTSAGDEVAIASRSEGNEFVLEVSDAGCGFSPDQLVVMFDRFARSGDRRGGTGLGLPIVQAIARAHGGSVSAGARPGGGSVFTIRLPGFTRESPVASQTGIPTIVVAT